MKALPEHKDITDYYDAFNAYEERFGNAPDLTIIRINESNAGPMLNAVNEAIRTGKKVSKKGWTEVEHEIFGDLYLRPGVFT